MLLLLLDGKRLVELLKSLKFGLRLNNTYKSSSTS
jgi:hypothetical protein